MRPATIATIGYPGPGWQYARREVCNKLGLLPNRAARNSATRQGLILVTMSKRGKDYPISCRALEYAMERERAGSVAKCYVGLVGEDGKLVGLMLVTQLYNILKRLPKQKGNGSADGSPSFGDYWWVTANFEPVNEHEMAI